MKSAIQALIAFMIFILTGLPAWGEAPLVRSRQSGPWSSPSSWEGGQIPSAGDRVQIKAGHEVVFDVRIESPIRSILIGGTLNFDPDRDSLLTVGLIKVQPGDDLDELVIDAHPEMKNEAKLTDDRPSLQVGTTRRPISAGRSATIRLAMVEGLDPEVCPAIICQGGRMEFHGAAVKPTWTKLGRNANPGDGSVVLDRSVEGWKVGDRVIVTSTKHQYSKNEDRTPRVLEAPRTEERTIKAIEGANLTLDVPLTILHLGSGAYRGEVALLSRNVVVESADPGGVRGHTMYHHGSIGSISFAEFRHLGKAGKLGKYSLHFHKVGDSMRGASVVGASIWDSQNRWITIHATNRLVVRDCVGYRSLGHGFFLEDGTEVDNILDHNLAVQATGTIPLPGQALAYDRNDGAGFWWANPRNAFIGNVAVESDAYGFHLDAPTSDDFKPALPIRGHDGRTTTEDIRTLPFLRFDSNEAHSQRRYGVNLNGPLDLGHSPSEPLGVGADSRRPLAIRGLLIWDCHWAFVPASPGLMVDGLELAHSEYGFWKPDFTRQAYRGVKVFQCGRTYASMLGQPPDPSRFPSPLEPVDDRPPVTVITDVKPLEAGRIRVSGSSVDDGRIKIVRVNGREARPIVDDFSRWEITLESGDRRPIVLEAGAEDSSSNVERTPHLMTFGHSKQPGSSTIERHHPTH